MSSNQHKDYFVSPSAFLRHIFLSNSVEGQQLWPTKLDIDELKFVFILCTFGAIWYFL